MNRQPTKTMRPPIASLSLDLDNKWSYMKTHGDPGWETYPSFLDVVVPRFLQVLGELDLRITVFVVGQDAGLEQNRSALAAISAAGHEIGNHSYRHEPWLHRYEPDEIETELTSAEDAIEEATGQRPVGFRGPGFSVSPTVIASLARRGYRYDGSTLPTFLGPLARMYYFLHAKLTPQERDERSRLFGDWREGFRQVTPYWWQVSGEAENESPRRLLEIPVTTIPLVRMPFHVSYLLYLRQFSRAAAWGYWRAAVALCRLTGVGPSLLLHPLDFLGGDDDADLAFFPGMKMGGDEKIAFVRKILADFAARFTVLPMGQHASMLAERSLRVQPLSCTMKTAPRELVTEATRP